MPLEDRPPPPAWPEVLVRTFDQERDTRAVYALVQDAFGDNERHTAESFEEWQAFMIDREAFEPGLWFIAESKGEIVGCVLCPNYEDEGWIRQLAVAARLAPPRARHGAPPPGHVRVQPPRPPGDRPRRRLVEPHRREGALRAGGHDGRPRARPLRRSRRSRGSLAGTGRAEYRQPPRRLGSVRRIGAEDAELPRQARHLGERLAHDLVERMPGQHGVEAVAPRRPRDRPRDELDEVEAVAAERLDRAVERARLVVGDEGERRAPALALAVEARVGSNGDEARVGLRDGRRRRRRSR